MIAIGVDPAFRKGGFWVCIIDTTERVAAFRCFRDVLEFDRWLQSEESPTTAFVGVENSNKQNKNFDMSGNRAELARKGRNVGTNQAVSELAVRASIDRYGEDKVLNISPAEKGRKWTAQEFNAIVKQDQITLWEYTGNQDQRDSYKLADMVLREAKKPVLLRAGKHQKSASNGTKAKWAY